MPIYEFDCSECGEEFEELVMSSNWEDKVSCPHCDSKKIHKKVSLFASRSSGVSNTISPAACTTST